MSTVEPARLIGNEYRCSRCITTLGAPIPPGQSDRPGIQIRDSYYVLAPADPHDPATTILTLRDTRQRRPRRTDHRGQIPMPTATAYRLPVLMQCRRPTCRQINRVEA